MAWIGWTGPALRRVRRCWTWRVDATRSRLPLDGGGQRRRRYVPLYEAKMVHQFDHRWATYDGTDVRDSTDAEKRDPDYEPTPRYWISNEEVFDRLPTHVRERGWLIGWRDICRATDERTLLAGVIPVRGCGDKFLLMFPDQPARLCAALYGSLNSLACDYVARQKLGGTSFKYFTMRQIAVLPPPPTPPPRSPSLSPASLS